MPHLASARAAQRLDLAHTERREVVVQHKALGMHPRKILNTLIVRGCTNRHRHKPLGLATRKERRTMGARQNAHFTRNRTHLIQTATINANALFGDQIAHQMVLEILIRCRHFLFALAKSLTRRFKKRLAHLVKSSITRKFGRNGHRRHRLV